MKRIPWNTPEHIKAGRGTCFTSAPKILFGKEYDTCLYVGNYTSFADGVTIMLGGQHHTRRLTTYQFHRKDCSYSKGDVRIGSDCWIGYGATILDGVTIENGAVVGAMSVVASDVPPYAVIVGNPARVIRFRFEPCIITSLLAIAWWNWPEEKIGEAWPLLNSEDPQPFIERYLSNGEVS